MDTVGTGTTEYIICRYIFITSRANDFILYLKHYKRYEKTVKLKFIVADHAPIETPYFKMITYCKLLFNTGYNAEKTIFVDIKSSGYSSAGNLLTLSNLYSDPTKCPLTVEIFWFADDTPYNDPDPFVKFTAHTDPSTFNPYEILVKADEKKTQTIYFKLSIDQTNLAANDEGSSDEFVVT